MSDRDWCSRRDRKTRNLNDRSKTKRIRCASVGNLVGNESLFHINGDRSMKRFFALGALLLALGASARADNFSVNITAGNIGQGLSNGQYAGTFSVTDLTLNKTFTAYCADTTDEVSFGTTTFKGALTTGGMPNNVLTGAPQNLNIWAGGNTVYTDVGNRLNYLLTQLMGPSLGTLTNAESAALQAGIWQAEGNYVVANGITDTLAKDVVAVLTGNTFSGGLTGWAALDALNTASTVYHAATNYASSSEILVVPISTGNSTGNPLEYQVLVGITPGEIITSVVPEPSSMAIAALGALGMIGYGWKRRKHA